MATEPSSGQREDTIKVVTSNSPEPAVVKTPTTSEDANESQGTTVSAIIISSIISPTEAVYYELENPSEVESLQLPSSKVLTAFISHEVIHYNTGRVGDLTRQHSSSSYTSISSDSKYLLIA